jgi:hypothetical protein
MNNHTGAQLIPLPHRPVISDDIHVPTGEGGEPVVATILLILLMIVTIAVMELIMYCSTVSKESVESRNEIAGD